MTTWRQRCTHPLPQVVLTRPLMHSQFRQAIVRPPSQNFADGLTAAKLERPHYELALAQHEAYCSALEQCGLVLQHLEADERFPDATFVEDTAVITQRCAVLTRPGAPERAGEVTAIAGALRALFPELESIEAPGTLDGGDICEAGDHFFIGLSERTNAEGAQQLAQMLAACDYSSSFVDIRGIEGILHLKSGISYVGENRLVVIEALANREAFESYGLIRAEPVDEYAANCVRVNEHVLIAAGYPRFESQLLHLGYKTIALEMSEFQKMDGGLSCLSLRF
jgi:dimethylargininase